MDRGEAAAASGHRGGHKGTSIEAIGVITQVERRRRWSDAQKLSILAEAAAPGVTVSEVCRRHGITSGLFYAWRHWQQDRHPDLPGEELSRFVEVQLAAAPPPSLLSSGIIEIALPGGFRVRVDATVDGMALRRVLAALRG